MLFAINAWLLRSPSSLAGLDRRDQSCTVTSTADGGTPAWRYRRSLKAGLITTVVTESTAWKPTREMAEFLAISVQTLRKRWGGPDGFLVEGEHWRAGPHHNSTRWWNVETVVAEAKARGHLFPFVLEQS